MNSQIIKTSVIMTALFFSASFSFGQTWCASVDQVSIDENQYVISISLQGSESFRLGSFNLNVQTSEDVFDLEDASQVSSIPQYIYDVTLTEPAPGKIAFNGVLGPVAGIDIAQAPEWTEIVQISLPISDIGQFSNINLEYTGSSTGTVLFLDDEATQIFATSPDCIFGIEAVGLPDVENKREVIELFPNPTSNFINIDFAALGEERCDVSIYNATGKAIYSQSNFRQEGQDIRQIDVSEFQPGVYLVKIDLASATISKRIVIVK